VHLRLACKTFQQAVNVVAAGGEVTAIDSAGFGPILITKAVTITSSAGIEAGVVPNGGDAIDVSAGPTDIVVLRGLTLNGGNSSAYGINGIVGRLEIIDCVVRNFATDGILLQSTSTVPMAVLISNTLVSQMSNTSSFGISLVSGGGTMIAALNEITVSDNYEGVSAAVVSGGALEVSISNSHIDNNLTLGILTAGQGPLDSEVANVILKNVTLNQTPKGIFMSGYSRVWLSQVTQQAVLGFTNQGSVVFHDSTSNAYSDMTNHLMGGVVGGSLGVFGSE
jgi:hypothetical protein